ncbi:MAG: alpha/beta hydrolase [Clostridia bacterium]|nr:alpha/beta hydrolase [Clostridia bacterium]
MLWQRSCKTIFIDGKHISVLQSGSGRDILFLHGYLSCKESFYYNIKGLEKTYRVTAFDFPGFGASSPIDSEWSVADYASFTKKFIKTEGLERPCVVAHSFGARVAIKLASNEDIFSAMLITGGAGMVKKRSFKYKRSVAAYRAVKKLAPKFAENHFGSGEYRQLSPVMKGSYKKIVNEDLLKDAERINCRTLLLYGKDDEVTPFYEEGEAFNRAIRGSLLKIMAGGHFCFAENPQEFNAAAAEFFG